MSAHTVSISQGKKNTRAYRYPLAQLEPLAAPAALAQALRQFPPGIEAWWSPHVWDGDEREKKKWEAAAALAVDVDYHGAPKWDERQDRYIPSHVAPPPEIRTRLEQAAHEGKLPGNAFHLTPRGARLMFVPTNPITDSAQCERALEGAVIEVSRALEQLGLHARQEESGCLRDGFAVDASATDLARFLYTPRATVNGEKRAADVLLLREDPCDLEALLALALEALLVLAPPAPAVAQDASAPPNNGAPDEPSSNRAQDDGASPAIAEAAQRWNAAHVQDWGDPGSGTCPACGHNDCFGRLPETPEKWCCFSSNHRTCGHPGKKGRWWGDALDLQAHKRKCSRLEVLLKDGYLKAAADTSAKKSNANDRLVDASLTGSAILAHKFPTRASLLGAGFISAGDLVLVYGKAKCGKTWLSLQLALAMARGEPWHGIATTAKSVPVGFLELEMLGDSMQARLRALGGEIPETLHMVVRPAFQGPLDLVDKNGERIHLGELRAWIEARGLQVVIVDALARATSCPQVDFSPLLLALDSLRADLTVAIILVHHEGKPAKNSNNNNSDADDLDAMRGDSRLSGFPQAILRVVKKAGNLHAVRFIGNGPAQEPAWFTLDPDTGVPKPALAPEKIAAGNRERVAKAVREAKQPITRAQIMTLLKLSKSTVADHLKALVEGDVIEPVGDWNDTRYRVRASEASEDDGPDAGI